MRWLLVIAHLVFSFFVFAQEPVSTEKKEVLKDVYYLCKSGSTVRTIRVEVKEKYCKAFYTKEGADQVVAHYKNIRACHPVAENIKGNLEKSKWKCKDISQARVSSSIN